VRPGKRHLAARLEEQLRRYEGDVEPLPGIEGDPVRRTVLVEQLVESVRRVRFVQTVGKREISAIRQDPGSDLFDPIRAAALAKEQGDIEEAFWLVFLLVHFGKHQKAGWSYLRKVYGRLDDGGRWTWKETRTRVREFRKWLGKNERRIKCSGSPGGFGNHRKYESLDASSPRGTGAAVETYVRWIDPPRTHKDVFAEANAAANNCRHGAFEQLYRSMVAVASFGRTARFDYLTMIGNLGLVPIEPGRPYLLGATGPLRGARLLFAGTRHAQTSPRALEAEIQVLDSYLGVGMQALEDALCNWQKSPGHFLPFRG